MTAPDLASDRCWSTTTGEGPRVVVVHGTMDRSSSFARIARRLPDRSVTRYDRRGYGRSLGLGPPGSFVQQVEDLLEVVGDRPAVVFGHSYGGTVALAAAAGAPDLVRGVLLYESPMPWLDSSPGGSSGSAGSAALEQAERPADAAERFMRRMLGDDRWLRLPPSTRDDRRAEGPTMIAELRQIRPPDPPTIDLAAVSVPVVAARGELAKEHHRRAIEHVAATVPGARFEVLGGAGHAAHLTHADELATLIRSL